MINNCGIYTCINLLNSRQYIGSAVNLKRRKADHFNYPYKSNVALQNAMTKYGKENFEFRVLEYCNMNNRIIKEQFWMDKIKIEGVLLYNICPKAGSPSQEKQSEESNKKRSLTQKGQKRSLETRKKLSLAKTGENNPNFGKHLPKSTRLLLSIANSGENHPMFGKPRSDITKEKLKLAKIGKKQPNISKAKQGTHYKTHCKRGHLRSPENLDKNLMCKTCANLSRRDKTRLKRENYYD